MSTTYDPKKVSVSIDGTSITGFATDSMIVLTQNEDAVTPTVGCQGDTAYSDNANDSGNVALSLQATSSSLARIRRLCDERKKFQLTIIDANEDDPIKISEEDCRILKKPDATRAKTVGNVTCNIYVPHLIYR